MESAPKPAPLRVSRKLCIRCNCPIENFFFSDADLGWSHRECAEDNLPILHPMGRYEKPEEVTFTGKVVDSTKRTNPKDAVGTGKAPMSTVPGYVMLEVGLAMLEGARKYGRHNYRDAGVRASVYYDALFRHMIAWWEGENIDPDSQLSHVTKAIATLVVLRDAMINGKLTDDRPPALAPDGCLDAMNRRASHLLEMYPDAPAPHTEKPE